MPVGELCIRQVVVTPRESSVLDVAKLMRQYHVGDVIVTDGVNGRRAPVGIVTDRDIVVEVLAEGLDPGSLSAGDIMSTQLTTVRETEGLFQTIQVMRARGARRAPVVNNDGVLIGIVSVDDLIELLAQELSDLSTLIAREQKEEAELRR